MLLAPMLLSMLMLAPVALLPVNGTAAQSQLSKRTPVVYTTTPQRARVRVVINPLSEAEASGQATFTVTRANDDDSLSGTLQFAFDPDSRAKIAEILKLPEAPATLARTEVRARFRSGSACPVAHLELDQVTLEASGVRLILPKLILTIIEDKDAMTPQLCFLARQINVGKMRRGVIAAINSLIRGEIEEPESKE